MVTLLSNIFANLTEGIHKIKCKDCDWKDKDLEYESVKDNLIKYKSLSYNQGYSSKINQELKQKFKNNFKFSDSDINKFILLLRKGVHLYEHMDD